MCGALPSRRNLHDTSAGCASRRRFPRGPPQGLFTPITCVGITFYPAGSKDMKEREERGVACWLRAHLRASASRRSSWGKGVRTLML